MSTRARCLEILEILQDEKKVVVSELAERFAVSEMTIRRDLSFLSKNYNITRTHGGAYAPQGSVVRIVSFDEARIEHRDEKERIARAAAQRIAYRQRLFIDSGSTTSRIVHYLSEDMKNVVVTNNLHVAGVALETKKLAVIMIGGEMLPIAGCSSGTVAEEQIKLYEVDIAFLGAAAIGRDGKLYDGYSPEARLKDAVFDVAKEIYLLADSSKFNVYDLHAFGSLHRVSHVITDGGIDSQAVNLLKRNGVNLIIAE